MLRKFSARTALSLLCLCCILLSGCANSPATTIESPADAVASATETGTTEPTMPSIPTATASSTPEATPMPSPTATLTPTATPFRTANGYLPGMYNTGGCTSFSAPLTPVDDIHVKFCVWYIEILKSGKMRVTVSWDAEYDIDRLNQSARKESDSKNENMYMRDNLGNHYNHIDVGGDAAKVIGFWGKETFSGWFLFPEPKPGATYFTFVDWDNHIEIPNMMLTSPMPLNKETLNLQSQPFSIEYKTDIWKPAQGESGEIILTNLKNEKCQITERVAGQPEGQLKSKLEIGATTFDIYKWLESEQNMGYRDYVAISGLDGLDGNQPLIFRVSIPLDYQDICLAEASTVFYTLSRSSD